MISIIMPAYNAERYIEESIKSVLSQTYIDWELIIVDDCSQDQTPLICENYTAHYKNIHYFRNQSNKGVAESRNRGVALSQGDWIAFIDSDDCWHSQKLELQLALAVEKQALFIFTGSSFINDNSESLDYYLSVPSVIYYKELLKQNVISCSSVLIYKKLLLCYPMENGSRMHEDFAAWLKVLKNEKIGAFGINQPLLIYRISSTSKSGNKIKAGIMTYRVYRHIGVSIIPAIYYWICYFFLSLNKYKHLVKRN
ncbi:glycosyltransferase family 2 protein [Lacrimispora xylanolytica]|uniref:Glycosyltransferase n=1 Tax=Lacrimispora xylanolytica TaxID=29375 RepID=A0ABY7AGG9_9FIRM|nr:glycosyltransferase [Lacrimispora xylanolytica]WAJ24553.1 glycosyltransferase [Lacrimispora xylanolytica]